MTKKHISNQEYENYLNNPSYRNIMNFASKNFLGNMDQDEIESCRLVALWNAMQQWKPNKKTFKSYLYQHVKWECLKHLQKQYKNSSIIFEPDTVPPDPLLYDLMNELGPYYKDVVEKKYFDNMTLREIGEEYGYCYESIRQHIINAIEEMKNVYYSDEMVYNNEETM